MGETGRDFIEAMDLFGERKYVEAEKKLRGILDGDPNHLDSLEALCVTLGNQERYREAIDTAKKWLDLDANAIMAYTNLSRFYMKLGMIAEAEAAQAKSRLIGWQEEIREQKKQAEAQQPQGPPPPPRPSPASPEENVKKFEALVEQDPSNILSRFSLGSAYADAMQYQNAAGQYRAVIDLKPDHAAAYLELGKALEKFDAEAAAEIYRKGIDVAQQKGAMLPKNKMRDRLSALTDK